uniref:HAP1 N-terminal domain-containing protein n=1 Tax=Panagrellus redivivus TaxID=6233 RepID=A0A7E4VTA8_PANRE
MENDDYKKALEEVEELEAIAAAGYPEAQEARLSVLIKSIETSRLGNLEKVRELEQELEDAKKIHAETVKELAARQYELSQLLKTTERPTLENGREENAKTD